MIYRTFDKYEDFRHYERANALSNLFSIRSFLRSNRKGMAVPARNALKLSSILIFHLWKKKFSKLPKYVSTSAY